MSWQLAYAELLCHHRLAASMTQRELAEHAGLSLRTVSDLERGLKRPQQRTRSIDYPG